MSYTCGTGSWSGPLPGDPSTNSILTATPVFGGIDITWTPAIVNPHAVIHTYLYRSTNPDFLTAVRIATVGGTHFYDKLENILTYYYWIQVVSINGTVGEVIGPASAIPRLSIDATIEALTGRIDNGVLAQSLKSEIDRISLIDGDLFQEIQDRIAANELLGAAIQTAQTDASQAVSLLNEEITQRTTAYNVLLQTLNTMAGQVNDNKAAIETESTLRISNDEALAQQITNVQSAAEDNLAAVQTTLQTNIDTVNGKVTDIGALYTAKVQVNGLIGGFGVYNDGTEVQAGFDVDTFWVGRTGPDKKKPFIIDSDTGETYIDKAVIPTLTADMIDTKGLSIKDMNGDVILSAGTALDWSRIGGTNKPEDGATVGMLNTEQSDGYTSTNGWKMSKDGTFSANGGGNQLIVGLNSAKINFNKPGGGTSFAVDQQGNALFAGQLLAATGTFAGTLQAGVLDPSAFAGIVYTYATAGTRTVTVPAKPSDWASMNMRVTLVGGGGGGGGARAPWDSTSVSGEDVTSYNRSGGGGGGGAGALTTYVIANVTPGASYSLTVGAGGAGGSATYTTGDNGGNGGTTSMAGVGSAAGGTGGTGTGGSTQNAAGGSLGGLSGTGYTRVFFNSNYVSGSLTDGRGGNGGSTSFGAGGAGGAGANGVAGTAGSGGGGGGSDYGTGGASTFAARSGGAGGTGYAIVEFFDKDSVVTNTRYSNLIAWLDSRGLGAVPSNAR